MEPSDVSEPRSRIVAAKLSLPHMGFVLSRSRLAALMEPVRGGGLVCLCAGPGYGKTALIVDRLSSIDGNAVYYSVDEGDANPLHFMAYLMAGLGMEPIALQDAQTLDWSAPGGIDQAVFDFTTKVIDFMAQKAGQPTLIAIDDFHLAASSSQVVNALELVVRALPPAWTVFISSRRPIPLRLDVVSLGGRFVQLGARDLRLTPREVTAWALHNWGVELQPSEARALWRHTQGWPAALVLLGQRLLSGRAGISHEDIQRVIARGHDLRDYLEQGILSGLDEPAAQTMLTAGLLPRVMFPRDEVFFSGPSGQAEIILEELVARGYLVARAGRRSYTVHPLVRAFARREAWSGKDTDGLIGRTAEHLENIGEHHRAVSIYLRSGRFNDAARLLRSLFVTSFGVATGLTRNDWLLFIPDNVHEDNAADPWLIVAKARILQEQTDYARAGAHYERAARILAGRGDNEGLLPVLLGSAFCLFNRGLWEESLAVMKRCRSLATSPREKAEVLVVEGGVLVGLCRWDEAVENWEKALVLTPSGSREALSQRIHVHRSRLFYSLGNYRLAKLWADKAIENGNNDQGSLGRTLALNGAAILAGLTGDYDRAGRLVDECCRLSRTRGYSLVEIPILLNQAMVALGRWDYRHAIAKIREAQTLAAKAGDTEESYWAESMLGDLCRRNSNPRRALEHHRIAFGLIENNRLATSEKTQALAAIGMDLVVLGQGEEAQAALEETVQVGRRWGLNSSLAPALFYLGWLHACAGRERETARSLCEAVRIADEHDHIHFFSQEAKIAVPILALCDRFGNGSFVRGKIMPLLPASFRAYFLELAEGSIYPTDVPLGGPRRRALGVKTVARTPAGQGIPAVEARIESLTEREREVLTMVGLGMPNKVIGAKLYISEKTVKTHTNHIFRKLGVANRLQATLAFQSYQRANLALSNRRHRRT